MIRHSKKSPLIGITLGDPCGIGPEVIAKSLSTLKSSNLLIIGDEYVMNKYSKPGQRSVAIEDLKILQKKSFTPGRPNSTSAQASLSYLNHAIQLLKKKKIKALVTGPVFKEGIGNLGISFHGHTEFLASAFNVKNFAMMFVAPGIKSVVMTRHTPLKKVSSELNIKSLEEHFILINESLKNQFKIKKPKIAVCGLNPHAGEGGTIGLEEKEKIIPAMEKARRKGCDLLGPFSADTLFTPDNRKKYDCFVAMYHDQGLIPIKTLYFSELVNLTIGLPFIRTSPAHGTAFDIAGQHKADSSSMKNAILWAEKLSS